MARANGIFGTPPRLAGPLGLGAFTWKNTDKNAEVASFQTALNTFLKKYGYYQLEVDGRLGPATCGAWLHLMNTVDGIAHAAGFPYNEELINTCQAWTYPTKVGSSTPEKNPIIEAIVDSGDYSLPWGTKNADTTKAQEQLNQHLSAHGMNTITVDGKLGGSTCGAARWLDQNTGSSFESMYGKNCQSFTMPTKKESSSTPVVVPPTPGPAPGPAPIVPVTPAKPKISTAAMVTGIAVLGGLGAAAWMYSKKKGHVANRSRRRRRR